MVGFHFALFYSCITIFSIVYGDGPITRKNKSWQLEKDIFTNYTWKWRPALVQAQKTLVTVIIYLKDINDVDENQQTVTLHGGIYMLWNDYRLQWDPDKYDDNWYIVTNAWRPWKPDWTVYNSFHPMDKGPERTTLTNNQVWIYYDGTVSYYTLLTKTITCVFDYTDWPFDTQKCHILIGSWMYDYSQIDFNWSKARNIAVSMEWLGSPINRTGTSGWITKNIKLKKYYWAEDNSVLSDPPPLAYSNDQLWPLLSVEFELKRNRPYFVLLQITPLILTSLLTVFCFIINSEMVASGILLTTLLVQGLCSWSIIIQLPSGGTGSVPKIIIAYGACFGLTCVALLLHIILQRLKMQSDGESGILSFMKKMTTKRWLSGLYSVQSLKITSFGTDYQEIVELTEGLDVSADEKKNDNLNEFVRRMKHILFIIFGIIYAICFCVALL